MFDEFSISGDSANVQAAINWANAVDCDNLACSGDAQVSHDFDLFLEQKNGGVWKPILKSQRRGGTTQWLRAHLKKYVTTPENNRFRFSAQQVFRRVDRNTHLGFAFYGDRITSEEIAGLVKIPENDPSPPALFAEVKVGNALYILTPQSEDLYVGAGQNDVITITAYARDTDGGVKDVCINHSHSLTCSQDDLAQYSQAITAPHCNPDEQAFKGFAFQSRSAQRQFNTADYVGCRSGWTFAGATLTLSADGGNFSQNVHTATLHLSIH